MREVGADFLVTGEVLGQRPKSQLKDSLIIVDRHVEEMGISNLLLRPLCAKLLPETIPEQEGWVDREALYDFQGRTRKPQIALAKELGIDDYESPAGGCLLTDPGFTLRLRDLMKHDKGWNVDDVRLLRIGRHFRMSPEAKIVVSRNSGENDRLIELAITGDQFFITHERPGALVLMRGNNTESIKQTAAGLAVYYSKFRDVGSAHVRGWSAENINEAGDDLGDFKVTDPKSLGKKYLST